MMAISHYLVLYEYICNGVMIITYSLSSIGVYQETNWGRGIITFSASWKICLGSTARTQMYFVYHLPHTCRERFVQIFCITSATIVEERYSFYFLCTRISLTPTMILGLLGRTLLLLSPPPQPPPLVFSDELQTPRNLSSLPCLPFRDPFRYTTRYYNNMFGYTTIILSLEDFGHQWTVLYVWTYT